MEKKTILIAEILHEDASNGVNRHSEMLLNGLPKDVYRLIYLKLVIYKRIAFPYKIAHRDYLEIAIPIPVNSDEIIGNDYWNAEYNKLIEHFVEPYLICDFIIHIQTMNLIGLALFLRQKYHCKIVSHIHCIPWKYNYAANQLEFNSIYYKLYIERKIGRNDFRDILTKNESNILDKSDAIICVTKSAKHYYEKHYRIDSERIYCVYNGIRDDSCDSGTPNSQIAQKQSNEVIRLLYVGNVSRNKGFHFVLEALKKVHSEGCKFILYAAGAVEEEIQKLIDSEYKYLDIRLLGHINYSKLQRFYESSHIGLIPSLFEQCSYVALEMSMYGLPVIYSDIEELNEIFNRKDGMFVPVSFTRYSSLTLDVCEFASKIIRLMKSSKLRKEIGIREHSKFDKYFRQEDMIRKTIDVYNNL